MTKTIAQRELRNANSKVIDAVASGETFVVTRHGVPVAELRPITKIRRSLIPKAELKAIAAEAPHISADKFRADLDRVVDQAL